MSRKIIYGADIDQKIKAKLRARQESSNRTLNPNEPIYKSIGETNFDGVSELSSRTPFARMWTAVQLYYTEEQRIKKYAYKEVYTGKNEREVVVTNTDTGKKETKKISDKKESVELIYDQIEELEMPLEKTVYVLGDNNYNNLTQNVDVNQSILNGQKIGSLGDMQVPSMTGGNTLNKMNIGINANNVFNKEMRNNQFLRPPAGITSISSKLEGQEGALKRVTVNFVVYNAYDFENIYQRFFMKAGAQVFVDFGWDTADIIIDDTKISQLKKGDTIDEVIFGEKGYVSSSNGDLETIIGKVVKWDSKVRTDGSFECVVEIVSSNMALLDQSFNISTTNTFLKTINVNIIEIVAKKLGVSFLKDNWSASVNTAKEYLKYANTFAKNILSAEDKNAVIPQDAVELGVYWQALTGDKLTNNQNLFISFGFFEDELLNSEYGIKMKEGFTTESFDVEFDSSNSFVRFDENLYKRQTFISNESHESKTELKFLYPENWSSSYNVEKSKVPDIYLETDPELRKVKRSMVEKEREEAILQYEFDVLSNRVYQTRNKERSNYIEASNLLDSQMTYDKLIENLGASVQAFKFTAYRNANGLEKGTEYYVGNNPNLSFKITDEESTGNEDNFVIDKKMNRIPIRELFINVSLIKEGFNSKDNINDAIKFILDEIDKDSGYVFNLRMYDPTGLGTKLEIVCANLSATFDDIESNFDNYFMFKPTSDSSIVKSFDLSYSTPEGGLQDLLAIQNSSAFINVFPEDPSVAVNNAFKIIDNVVEVGSDTSEKGVVSLKYYPPQSDDNVISKRSSVFDKVNEEGANEENTSAKKIKKKTLKGKKSLKNIEQYEGKAGKELRAALYDGETEEELSETDTGVNPKDPLTEQDLYPNSIFAKNFEEYYKLKAKKTWFNEISPVVLDGINLNLSLYGISGLLPGQRFRLNYLPKKYLDNIVFQIYQITQEISNSSWTTTIESKMWLRAKTKKDRQYLTNNPENIYISGNYLSNLIKPKDLLTSLTKFEVIDFKDVDTSWKDNRKGTTPLILIKCKSINDKQVKYPNRYVWRVGSDKGWYRDKKIQIKEDKIYYILYDRNDEKYIILDAEKTEELFSNYTAIYPEDIFTFFVRQGLTSEEMEKALAN